MRSVARRFRSKEERDEWLSALDEPPTLVPPAGTKPEGPKVYSVPPERPVIERVISEIQKG